MNDFILDQLRSDYFDDNFKSIGIRPCFDWSPEAEKLREAFVEKFRLNIDDKNDLYELISTEVVFESDKAFKDGLRIGAMLYKELMEKEKAVPDEQDSGT